MIKQITDGDVRVTWQNDRHGKTATLSRYYRGEFVKSKKILIGERYEPTSDEMIEWLRLAKLDLLKPKE